MRTNFPFSAKISLIRVICLQETNTQRANFQYVCNRIQGSLINRTIKNSITSTKHYYLSKSTFALKIGYTSIEKLSTISLPKGNLCRKCAILIQWYQLLLNSPLYNMGIKMLMNTIMLYLRGNPRNSNSIGLFLTHSHTLLRKLKRLALLTEKLFQIRTLKSLRKAYLTWEVKRESLNKVCYLSFSSLPSNSNQRSSILMGDPFLSNPQAQVLSALVLLKCNKTS